jgi:pectin methylesterase-like acyl-CoA thioesterase
VLQTLVLTALLALCSNVSTVNAANITVGAGRTFTTIQAALDSAQAGDMILVDDGTYSECKKKREK